MSRNNANISLAGWLFADLALVLFVIFLPSSVSGEDITRELENATVPTTTTSTTTTSVPVAQPDGRGVVPEPIEIRIKIDGNPLSLDDVDTALEDGLRESAIPQTIKFGVIQVLAGIRGEDTVDSRNSASRRADDVARILTEIANADSVGVGRLKPWLYTLSGSDASLRFPEIKLRLFPDNE